MRVPTSRGAQRRQDRGVACASADLAGGGGGGRGKNGTAGSRESSTMTDARQDGGRLDLVLANLLLLRARGRGLKQLDLRRRVLLELLHLLLRLLEGRLQLLEQGVVRLLAVAHRLLQLLELGCALLGRHRDVLLQLRLLRIVAVLHGVDRAARAQLSRRKLLERGQVAAALVVLALLVGRVEVFDGRVASNTELVAKRLAGRGAVNVTDDNLRVILELSAKGVPVRLHLFAVASPRRLELDERGLAGLGDQLIIVVQGELNGRA